MSAPLFSEAIIRQHAEAESFRRGQAYYAQGAVLSVVQRGKVVEAKVEGSAARPYTVRCTFDERGEPRATCTCPYDWGGWCKHIVATCLTLLHRSEQIEERPTLETILADLEREQLQALLLKLAERDSSLPDVIEGLLVRSTIATGGHPAPINATMVRRQVQAAFRQRDNPDEYPDDYSDYEDEYWDEDEDPEGVLLSTLDDILDRIQALIAADEGYGALLPLQTFTEEVLSEWETMGDDTDILTEFLDRVGSVWTEALLSADLTSEERTFWIKQLDDWMLELDEEMYGEVFAAAQEAAARGWDYPPLQRVLQGQSEQKTWEGAAPYYANELTMARLAILERRGRQQEYLYLAKAEGQLEAYLTMLVRVGRIDEAVEYGMKHLQTVEMAFNFAKVLYGQGAHEQSLRVAEHALTLQGTQTALARWLREEAAKAGKQELALKAAIIVFHEDVTLLNYLQVAELAGEQWPQEQEALLEYARAKSERDERIYIFLHEGLIDEAIAAVGSYTSLATTEKVVDAAMSVRPEWAIGACRGKAETLIQQGSSHYDEAARWLAKARAGYQQLDALVEWREYLGELMSKHKRKYRLMDELRRLH